MGSITFVTGNENKWKEIQAILGDNCSIQRASIDLPELQGTIESIAKEKCKTAAKQMGTAVITEDTALCFDAMGELPGPYIKWFLEQLGHEGLNKMVSGWESKAARAICTISYAAGPDAEPILFQGVTHGKIVEARGPNTFGWDPIFMPDHESSLTYAEMPKEIKYQISHRSKALHKLRDFLASFIELAQTPEAS